MAPFTAAEVQTSIFFFLNVREMKLSHHLEKITSVWARKWYWFRGLKCVLLHPFKALHFLQQHSRYSFSVNCGRGGWHGRQALSSVLFSSLSFFFLKKKDQTVWNHSAACDLSLVGFLSTLRCFQTFSYTGCLLINYFTIVLFNRRKKITYPVTEGLNAAEVISKAKLFARLITMLQSNTKLHFRT